MELINAESTTDVKFENLRLLSDEGSEFVVYYDGNKVYKIFKSDYSLKHKNFNELIYLSSIKTSRILMPESVIIENGQLIGYSMQYVKNSRSLLDDKMKQFIDELIVILSDIDLLSDLSIRLVDAKKNNIVYNGKLYLIDPGNYFINYIKDLLDYLDNKSPTEEEKKNIIKSWNYNAFNKLIEEILFIGNKKLDFYLLRKVFEFFKKAREDNGFSSNIGVLQKYFDLELSVRESIDKFVKEYIKVDENERMLIMSLFAK